MNSQNGYCKLNKIERKKILTTIYTVDDKCKNKDDVDIEV